MNLLPLVITIDGTSACGKSSLASKTAETLGLVAMNSGLLYRTVASLGLQTGTRTEKGYELLMGQHRLDFKLEGSAYKVEVNGQPVVGDLGTKEISGEVPNAASYKVVRDFIDSVVQTAAKSVGNRVVAEGRDMGTVVFPKAHVKFFVDADLDVRARWRAIQRNKGESPSAEIIAGIRADLANRDEADRTRKLAPLVPAIDAIPIANGVRNLDDTVKQMVRLVRALTAGI